MKTVYQKEILDRHFKCICRKEYIDQDRDDPQCVRCNNLEKVVRCMDEYAELIVTDSYLRKEIENCGTVISADSTLYKLSSDAGQSSNKKGE
jgi:hypothetical protein